MQELPKELLPTFINDQTALHKTISDEFLSAQPKLLNNAELEETITFLRNLIAQGKKAIDDKLIQLKPYSIGRGKESSDFQSFAMLNKAILELTKKIDSEIKRAEQTIAASHSSLLNPKTAKEQDSGTSGTIIEEQSFSTLEKQLRHYVFQETPHEEHVDAKKALDLILDRAVMMVAQKPYLEAEVRSCLEDTLKVLRGNITPEQYIQKAEQRSTNLQHLGSAMLAFGALLAVLCVVLAPPVGAIIGGTLGLLMVAASPIPFFKGTTSVDYLDKSALVDYIRSDKVKSPSDDQLSIDSAPEHTPTHSPGFPNQ